jgi:hypothetical protein
MTNKWIGNALQAGQIHRCLDWIGHRTTQAIRSKLNQKKKFKTKYKISHENEIT